MDPRQLLLRRSAAQLLDRRIREGPEAGVRRLLAVQAQDRGAWRLALRARVEGITAAHVNLALSERRSLVVAWLNRGTLHLVCTEDYTWLLALTAPTQAAGNRRRLAQTGLSPEDVERELGLTVIGVIPTPPAGVNIEDELRNARSGAVEAIRSLRTGLQFSTSNGLPQSLLFTSAKNSEGKTTTSIGTATSLAQIGLNVLLIDADLRSPKVHRRLSLGNEVGLSNYLTGAAKPEDLVQATPTPGLVVLTSGPMPINPAELLAGPKFQSLLALATQSFNVVIVDGPPVMGLADAPLLASVAHSTILVIAANETRKSFVRVALRRLQLAKASIIGALLSKFDTREVGYGYGYGYGEYQYGDATEYLPLPNDKTR